MQTTVVVIGIGSLLVKELRSTDVTWWVMLLKPQTTFDSPYIFYTFFKRSTVHSIIVFCLC